MARPDPRGAGPVSWAIAVDDMEVAREALVSAGFEPGPALPGSRRTPDGDLVEWVGCDLASRPYDDELPFLIQWTRPMPPGPADGPIVQWIGVSPGDPDRVADLLVALGFAPSRHWPRRVFHEVDGPLGITLPLEPVEGPDGPSWSMSWEETDQPPVSVSLDVAAGEGVQRFLLDGMAVSTHADRRRFAASTLLPAVDVAFAQRRGDLADWPNPHPGGRPPMGEEYSRRMHPDKYRLLTARADAWVEAVAAAGLGVAEERDPSLVSWVADQHLPASRATVLRGRPGTQPVVVGLFEDDSFVKVGVGEPVEVLETLPDCGCDACDTGSADLIDTLDSAFVLALSGGVHVVRDGSKVVTRSLDGNRSSGRFEPGEQEQWLAEAADGRRTAGVVAGEPWIS